MEHHGEWTGWFDNYYDDEQKIFSDFKENGKDLYSKFAWNKTDDLIGTWLDHESKFKKLASDSM